MSRVMGCFRMALGWVLSTHPVQKLHHKEAPPKRTSGVGAEAPDLLGQLLVPAELLGQDLGAHLGAGWGGVQGCRAADVRGSGGKGAGQRMRDGGRGGAVASGTGRGGQAATRASQEHCQLHCVSPWGHRGGQSCPHQWPQPGRPQAGAPAGGGERKARLVRCGVMAEGSCKANWCWCGKRGCKVHRKQREAASAQIPRLQLVSCHQAAGRRLKAGGCNHCTGTLRWRKGG